MKTKNVQEEEPFVFMIVEEKPLFEGGGRALMQLVAKIFVYPEEVVKQETGGQAFVHFVIDEKVKDTKFKILGLSLK